jgi:hypothetical protein
MAGGCGHSIDVENRLAGNTGGTGYMRHDEALPLTVCEYQMMFAKSRDSRARGTDWAEVEQKLQTEGEWTRTGAAHVTELARDYGAFVLRNALALAIALNIEDGELGL